MLERRRLEQIREADLDGVVGRDAVGEGRREQHQEDQDGSRCAERPLPDEVAPEADETPRPGRLEVVAARDLVGLGQSRSRELRHEYRIRGSRTTYTMSTTKLMSTKTEASSSTSAWISV